MHYIVSRLLLRWALRLFLDSDNTHVKLDYLSFFQSRSKALFSMWVILFLWLKLEFGFLTMSMSSNCFLKHREKTNVSLEYIISNKPCMICKLLASMAIMEIAF